MNKLLRRMFLCSCMAISAACTPFANADWPSFRNGGASHTTDALPLKWSSSDGIAWQTELIGYGQSTPVIYGGKIYVTSVEGTMKDNCVLQCLDLKSGKALWRFTLEAANKAASNYAASRAAPTPIVDASGVYAFFESGDVVSVDHAGTKRWHRNLTADYGKFENGHGLGASPAVFDGRLIVNIEHKGPSYLLALDMRSGTTIWKSDRPSSSSWSSPIAATIGDKSMVIVSSAGTVTAYDPITGGQLWQVGGLDGNSVPSPTLHGSKLLVGARLPEFADENSGAPSNCCIDMGSPAKTSPDVVWRAEKVTSDYASPVVSHGCAYYINKAGVVYCLDIETGKTHYAKRLGTQCWGTPIATQDRIYFFGKDGKTLVLKSGPQYEVIATNELWDAANPPKPETYVEAVRSERSTGDTRASTGRGGPGGASPNGGGMLSMLKAADKDGDGILSTDEVPGDFKPMMARIDTNADGRLDESEMKAMAESFAARRANSASEARDPIVYGAVASDGRLVIRTGTRLYCIQ
jgi:outer membrane protein assembly factor BamB